MYAINININLTKNAPFVPFTTRGGGDGNFGIEQKIEKLDTKWWSH